MHSEIPGLSQSPIVNHGSLLSAQSADQNSPCNLQGELITSTDKKHVIPAHLSSLETLKSADSSVQLNCGGIDDDQINVNIVENKPVIDLVIGDNKDNNVNVMKKTLKTVSNVNKKLTKKISCVSKFTLNDVDPPKTASDDSSHVKNIPDLPSWSLKDKMSFFHSKLDYIKTTDNEFMNTAQEDTSNPLLDVIFNFLSFFLLSSLLSFQLNFFTLLTTLSLHVMAGFRDPAYFNNIFIGVGTVFSLGVFIFGTQYYTHLSLLHNPYLGFSNLSNRIPFIFKESVPLVHPELGTTNIPWILDTG